MGGVGLNDLLLTAIEQGVYRSGARLNGDAVVINLSELSPLADAVTELPPALPRIVEGRVPSDCARTADFKPEVNWDSGTTRRDDRGNAQATVP